MVLKRIFSKENIIILLLLVSLGSNVYLLYESHQMKKGLIAQLEMIDSIFGYLPEINNQKQQTQHRLYMEYFKGIAADIDKINARLGYPSNNYNLELEQIKDKQDNLDRDISLLRAKENDRELDTTIKQMRSK